MMRISIRVKPGAGRTRVGGEHDGSLVVAVAQRAVDGRATEAALAALAEAFGVRRRDVTLVTGATSRTKVVDIDIPVPGISGTSSSGGPGAAISAANAQLTALLAGPVVNQMRRPVR